MPPAQRPIRVRRGRSDDLEAMWALEQAVVEPRRRAARDALARSLGSASERVWVAESGGKLVAFLIAWFRSRIWRIYDVTAPRTGTGDRAGRDLLQAAEQMARATGAEHIALEAPTERVPYYAPLGYEVSAELPDRYGPGRIGVRLSKRIGPGR